MAKAVTASTEQSSAASYAGLEPEQLIRIYRLMYLSRRTDDREILLMATLALGILAAALLEREDLRAARLFDDFADDARARDERCADLARLAVEQREHFGERHPRARVALERHDGDLVFGGDLVLLAAGLDDCEHRFLRVQNGSTRGIHVADFFAVEGPAGFRSASPPRRQNKTRPKAALLSEAGV